MKPQEAQRQLRIEDLKEWLDKNRTRYEGAKATLTLVPIVNAAVDCFGLCQSVGKESVTDQAAFVLGQVKARLEVATDDMRFIRYYEYRQQLLDSMQRGTPQPAEGA